MRTMAFLAMTAALAAPPLLSPVTLVRDDEPTVGHAVPQSAPATVHSASQEPLAYTSVFEELGYDLFPTMPARVVTAGDSWTDTVTLSSTSGGARTSSTSIRTFTVGEVVVVEGRSLQMIGLSATVEASTEMDQGRMAMEQSFNGTQTGNFFWDAEAGLLRAAQLMNDFKGEAKMGRAPAASVTLKRIQRIWREY